MRPNPSDTSEALHPTRRAALLPAFSLLGIALPLLFLARIEQYLHYLRPVELLPTYATAWLLLALLCVLPCLLALLILSALHRSGLLRLERLVWFLLLWLAAAAAIVAILFDAVAWLRTFESARQGGIDSGIGFGISAVSLALALALTATRWGRERLVGLQPLAVALTVAGALCVPSLLFFRWDSAAAQGSSDRAGAAAAGAGSRPHIVLVTIDALSAKHMSLYGATRPTTPNLDNFARDATVFDRAYANANFTTASVASIMTGTRPWTHHAFQIFSWPTVATRRQSLPAALDRAGYLTAYVATNPYAGAARLGLAAYFRFGSSDQVRIALPCPDRLAAVLPYECPATQLLPLLVVQKLWVKTTEWRLAGSNRHYDPGVAIGSAVEWLRAADRSRPIFLWLHLLPPHAPYAAPQPWLGRFSASPLARDLAGSDPDDNYEFRSLAPDLVETLEARYDESVQYVDHYTGEFLREALPLLGDNTVVIVTADHGESFANGYGGHGGPGLYDSIIHVPLIIKLPRQGRGARIEAPVQLVDLAPTLAALAQIPAPRSWEGRSLLPFWDANASASQAPARAAFAMNFEENARDSRLDTGSLAVIDGAWKLIHYMGRLHYEDMPALHDELYDLIDDPGELADRSAAQPQELARLRQLAAEALSSYGGRAGSE